MDIVSDDRTPSYTSALKVNQSINQSVR